MKIGVLAVQGDFAAHIRALTRAGAEAVEIKRGGELRGVDGLVIPGGESTTMLKVLEEENLTGPIVEFARAGKPVFGTCAGAILLAREVLNPAQPSLALIDVTVERNAYGRQVDSFIAEAQTPIEGGPVEAVFIRAPRILDIGPGVSVLARVGDEPVMVRQSNILAATFHPELTEDLRVHGLMINMCSDNLSEPDAELTGAAIKL